MPENMERRERSKRRRGAGGTRPLVSVGLPLCRASQHLRETVESLLGQSWRDFELVIVDCSASPHVEEECRRLAGLDPRLRYLRRTGLRGPAEAHNAAFRRARGAYFRWATCNEVYAVDFLRQCVAAMQDHREAVLCHLRAKLIDGAGRFVGNYGPTLEVRSPDTAARFASALRAARPVCDTLGLVRAGALAHTGLVRPGPAAARLLLGELSLHGTFHPVPEYLLYARLSERLPGRPARDPHDPLRDEGSGGASGLRLREALVLTPLLLRAPLPWRTRLACVRRLLQVCCQARTSAGRRRARTGRRSRDRQPAQRRAADVQRT